MSDGIDPNPLIWRLHDGLREFQSWRNHRCQRAAPKEQPEAPPVVAAPIPSAHIAGDAGSMTAGLEPQGFVSYGGRLVPLFGDIHPSASVATPTPPSAARAAERFPPPPPPSPPPSEPKRDPEPSKRATAKPLNLGAPTPPACLGLRPQPASPLSADPPAPVDSKDVPSATPHLDDTRQPHTDGEVERLAQLQAEHRTLLAALLTEHREALRAQAEAAAAKQDLIVRELLAEHRAEVGNVLAAHSEHIRDLLAQHRAQEQRTIEIADHAIERHATSIADLSDTIAKQAEVQTNDHEQTAQHLDNLASFIGDLTQTISLLAAATFGAKPEAGATAPPQQIAGPPVTSVASSMPVFAASTPEPHTATPRSPPITASSGSVAATPSKGSESAPRRDRSPMRTHIEDRTRDWDDDDDQPETADPEGPPHRFPHPPIKTPGVDEGSEAANA